MDASSPGQRGKRWKATRVNLDEECGEWLVTLEEVPKQYRDQVLTVVIKDADGTAVRLPRYEP